MTTAARINQAQSAENYVTELIDVTRALSDIFTRENAILEAHRPRDLQPLQSEKARLAAIYAQSIKDVAINRSLVSAADERLLDELKSITRGFEERAQRQRALLDGAKTANEGVIKAVAAEASRNDEAPAYSKHDAEAAASTPIALNEQA